jgi:hypothetical protein
MIEHKEKIMTAILNTNVSEYEFQAALAAFNEIQNDEMPGAVDEDESFAGARAYWMSGESFSNVVETATTKATFMDKVKAFFA